MPKGKTKAPSQEIIAPHSEEAENSLIGSIILEPVMETIGQESRERSPREVYDSVSNIVSAEDFVDTMNKIIFRSFAELETINLVNITNWLTHSQEWSNLGSRVRSHLLQCSSLLPTNLHAEYYAQEVKRLSLLRKLVGIAGQLIGQATEAKKSINELVAYIEEKMEQILRESLSQNRRAKITDFKVLTSSPRTYEMQVNGKYFKCIAETLLNRKVLKEQLLNLLDFIPILPSQEEWDKYINSLLDISAKEETPIETGPEYELKEDVWEWLEEVQLAENYQDLKTGAKVERKVENQEYYLFQPRPLLKTLKIKKRVTSAPKLWASIKSWGGIKHEMRVGDIPCKLWGLPMNFIEKREEPKKEEEAPNWF